MFIVRYYPGKNTHKPPMYISWRGEATAHREEAFKFRSRKEAELWIERISCKATSVMYEIIDEGEAEV